MAHWFHRNPLKATAPVSFEFQNITSGEGGKQICNQLRQQRSQLLNLLTDPNNDIPSVVTAYTTYLSSLQGLITSPDSKGGDSKLRHLIRFRWTESMLGNTPSQMYDTVFEQCCMLCDVAIWYMKHAAKIAGKDDISMEEALAVHRTLRIAAGIFRSLQEEHVASIKEPLTRGGDLERAVLRAYEQQCVGEAQEVTIARAIELKHKPGLIAALTTSTARLFTDAEHSLQSAGSVDVFGKWRWYLLLKGLFYQAHAFTYYGHVLLAEDKCGAAIRCLQEAHTLYDKAVDVGKTYSKCKGPGVTVKPDQHLSFRQLKLEMKRTLDKCISENGFIYHQKVPVDVEEVVSFLQQQAPQHGAVQPDTFTVPPMSPAWTGDAYLAFDITKYSGQVSAAAGKQEDAAAPIAQVSEKSVHQTSKDPSNHSGCILS